MPARARRCGWPRSRCAAGEITHETAGRRGRTLAGCAAEGCAGKIRLRGRRGRRRAGRRAPGAVRALRSGGAGPGPAGARRPVGAARLARGGADDAGADPDGARQLARQGGRHRRRRRRLPDQAIPPGRTRGTRACAVAPRRRACHRGHPLRPAAAGYAPVPHPAERCAAGPDQPRIPGAGLPADAPGRGRVPQPAGGTHLRPGFRPRFEHHRGVRRPPAAQDPPEPDPDGARPGLPPVGRTAMTAPHPSLRLRLLAVTLACTLLSVALAGWGIQRLFRQHIQAQLQSELNIHLDQLTASLQVDGQGQVSLTALPTDPRFSHPFSGLYWQISVPSSGTRFAQLLRSRSLWDAHLPDMAGNLAPGRDAAMQAPGPGGKPSRLRLREVHPAEGPIDTLILSVAADEALWAEPISRFDRRLAVALGILALGMVAAAWMQGGFGLRPLAGLRERLAAVREGRADRIEGEFPMEVQPLVEDFNQVLRRNAEGLERARMQAGNLAHALKTPLAVMASAAQAEDPALPRLVAEQVEAARRQVDYHLGRAR